MSVNMNNSWLIKAGIPILGLILTIWGIFFTGTEKNLSYQIVSEIEFKSEGLDNWKEFSISYKGVKIENGGITTILIVNSGDTPIYPNEYDGPIKLEAVESSKFVDAKIISLSPKNLKPIISVKEKVLSINPLLLNPGDEITLQMVLGEGLGPLKVSARIGGIHKVSDLDHSRKRNIETISWLYVLYGLLGFTVYSFVTDAVSAKYLFKREMKLPTQAHLLIILVAIIAAIASFYHFIEIQDIDLSWSLVWYGLGILVLSEIIAIPFKKNRQKDSEQPNKGN